MGGVPAKVIRQLTEKDKMNVYKGELYIETYNDVRGWLMFNDRLDISHHYMNQVLTLDYSCQRFID